MSSGLSLLGIEESGATPEQCLWLAVLDLAISDAMKGHARDVAYIEYASAGFRRACSNSGLEYEWVQRKWGEYVKKTEMGQGISPQDIGITESQMRVLRREYRQKRQ